MPLPHYSGGVRNLSSKDLSKLIKDIIGIEPISKLSNCLFYEQHEYINSYYFMMIDDGGVYDIKSHIIDEFKLLKNVIRLKKLNSL